MNIADFISANALLGDYFAGPSWDRWRAVLKAAFALPMSRNELRLFKEVAGDREPPSRRVKELVCVIGRGGGKDSIATAIAAFIASSGDFKFLRPGEKAVVMLLAVDKQQAGIAFGYARGYFEECDLLRSEVKVWGSDTIALKNGAEIQIHANSMRGTRGRTIAAALYDEVSFWRSEEYANPDYEIDTAISPGLMRCPGSMKILISSAYMRAGLLYDRWSKYFGQDDDDVLVVYGPSTAFNPTLDQSEIDRQLAADYERAAAEYLSEWRDDLSNFIDRQLVEHATDHGVTVRPPINGLVYCAFVDVSGGRGDSFTMAISHPEDDRVILDLLYEKRAPFSPSTVVAEVAEILREYEIDKVIGDRYAASWTTEAFSKEGIEYETAEQDKSQYYLNSLPLFTAGRARLLESARLTHQLVSLERRTTRIGRDIVSHPDFKHAHDDLANAVCGALVTAAEGYSSWDLLAAKAAREARAEATAAKHQPQRVDEVRPAHPLFANEPDLVIARFPKPLVITQKTKQGIAVSIALGPGKQFLPQHILDSEYLQLNGVQLVPKEPRVRLYD